MIPMIRNVPKPSWPKRKPSQELPAPRPKRINIEEQIRNAFPGDSEAIAAAIAKFGGNHYKPMAARSTTAIAPAVSAVAPIVASVVPTSAVVSPAADASALGRFELPPTYTWSVFCAEFNIAPVLASKLQNVEDMGLAFIDSPLDDIDDEVWAMDDVGMAIGEVVTLKRKHAYLLKALAHGRFHLPNYTPLPSEFLATPPPLLTQLKAPLLAKLNALGFAFDDPEGMNTLTVDDWKAAGLIAAQRTSIMAQLQKQTATAPRFSLAYQQF